VSGHIVAMGGGGFSEEPDNPLLDRFVLDLARRPRPRVCFVPTASGDSDGYVARFYRAFAFHNCRAADLALFDRVVADVRAFVLEQDVIYVGGGNTVSLLAVWRAHGLDAILPEALASGAVLCGVSAGMNCWFAASTTDSYGPELAPLRDGLGLLAASACPHYDSDAQRRPLLARMVAEGFTPAWAADDGAALVFRDGELVEAVSSRPKARAYRVDARGERTLPTRYLGGRELPRGGAGRGAPHERCTLLRRMTRPRPPQSTSGR
jgi:dipeptidase E